jgi:hypothetical protein
MGFPRAKNPALRDARAFSTALQRVLGVVMGFVLSLAVGRLSDGSYSHDRYLPSLLREIDYRRQSQRWGIRKLALR